MIEEDSSNVIKVTVRDYCPASGFREAMDAYYASSERNQAEYEAIEKRFDEQPVCVPTDEGDCLTHGYRNDE
jgi:hypothetical protein